MKEGSASGAPVSRPFVLYFRSDPMTRSPSLRDGFVDRLSGSSFLPPLLSKLQGSGFYPARLSSLNAPAFRWTHLHAGLARRTPNCPSLVRGGGELDVLRNGIDIGWVSGRLARRRTLSAI